MGADIGQSMGSRTRGGGGGGGGEGRSEVRLGRGRVEVRPGRGRGVRNTITEIRGTVVDLLLIIG